MNPTVRTGGKFLSLALLTAMMGACSGVPSGKEITRLGDTPLVERNAGARMSAEEAVNFFAEDPVTILQTGGNNAFKISTDAGQRVPAVPIGEINASPLPFGTLLNQVAAQVGMSWRITGPDNDALLNKQVVFVQRSETMLEKVLDDLSDLTGSFYRIEGDRIIFSQDRHFVVQVPRMADSQDVLTQGLAGVGATDVFSDKLSGTVSFRATKATYDQARRLVASLENGRDMVVYDFWIIDRNINDAVGVGVDVGLSKGEDTQGITLSGTQLINSLTNGGGDGAFITGNLGDFGVEATVNFLRNLGEAETVARPTISMLSGASSSFSSGEKSEYIRSVDTSTNDSGTSSSGTDVRSLETGVKIEVSGSHNNGVISTDFEIDISELLAFEEFETGEVTLRLPKTSERMLSAHLEARPGDVMVLGGIIRDRDERDATEIAGTGLPTSRTRQANKTETIILVRPRLVQIRPAPGKSDRPATGIEPGVGRLDLEANSVAEVVEDEATARRLLSSMRD